MDEIKTDLEFEDFPYICRICLFKGDTKPFTQALGKTYKSLVTEYVEEEVELPRNLCSKCISKLEDIEVFIKLARVGNNHLKEVLLRHKNKVFVEDFDKDTKFEISEEESLIDENDAVFSDDVKDENSDEDTDNQDDESEQIERYQFHCKICKNIFISVQDLNEHKKDCILKCKTCGESFETFKQLDNHYNESEACQVSNELKCDICKKEFRKLSVLKKHAVSHTNDTPYECKLCDKKFKFPQNLRRHDNIVHKGVKPYKCDVCGKEFARLERLTRHKKLHSIKCRYCGEIQIIKSRIEYRQHLAEHKLDNQQIEEFFDKEKELKCQTCDVEFKRKTEYRQHILQHKFKDGDIADMVSKCEICGKLYSSKYALQSHSVIHSGKKEFLCNICGKEFLRKFYLDIHVRTHTGEKSVQCKICGKKFKQASTYNTHTLVHTGERSFKCDICTKSFKQSTHLTRHLLTHTGEKRFHCSYCGKSFAQNCNLKTHTRIHTGETPFHCSICSRGFYDTSSLKKHEKSHLKDDFL